MHSLWRERRRAVAVDAAKSPSGRGTPHRPGRAAQPAAAQAARRARLARARQRVAPARDEEPALGREGAIVGHVAGREHLVEQLQAARRGVARHEEVADDAARRGAQIAPALRDGVGDAVGRPGRRRGAAADLGAPAHALGEGLAPGRIEQRQRGVDGVVGHWRPEVGAVAARAGERDDRRERGERPEPCDLEAGRPCAAEAVAHVREHSPGEPPHIKRFARAGPRPRI
ncbi:MAG: hypothetical protein U1F43_22590 [Myxococcota bacterium]